MFFELNTRIFATKTVPDGLPMLVGGMPGGISGFHFLCFFTNSRKSVKPGMTIEPWLNPPSS